VIRTLLDRDLIDVVGRAEGLGRPLLYGTTQRFLEHFGFASLDQLPRPEELPVILRDRAPLEELLEREDEEEGRDATDVEEAPGGDLPEGDQEVLGLEGREDNAGQELEAPEEGRPPREGSHD
jgi:segregation and condensation protein B